MTKKFYVTTPIYYPNDILHVGHAYTTLAADILARWHRLKKDNVFFLTGTDEHGKKVEEAAKDAGKKPKQFVDELVLRIKKDWEKLNLTYDRFIRTTDKDHEKIVTEILQKVYDKGDIYLGEYEGFYCVPCEAYYTDKDLIEGCCPIHKKKVELLKEESYFFKLSKYQKKLLELYKKGFISPKNRNKEIVNRVKEGLKDLSISRTSFDWGIRLPFNKKHICYVWFDALTNYYSATRQKGKEKFWPADVHLIGKDILWFHSVYWPAILMSAEIPLPKKVFAHGWWTFDKEKISKSRGKVINIDELIGIAGLDSARYFLFRATPFGDDGDFSEKALIERHNNELADKLGNLVSRVSALAENMGIEKFENKIHLDDERNNLLREGKLEIEKIEDNYILKRKGGKNLQVELGEEFPLILSYPQQFLESTLLLVKEQLEEYQFDKALNEIFTFIDFCNEYVQDTRIWENQNINKKFLFELVESIRKINPYLGVFMPETSEKIQKIFKTDKIKKAEVLFKKIK